MHSIPVFYSEHMLAESGSFSPSAGKPRHVLAAWQKAGLPIAEHPIAPASKLDFCLAHDPAYVHGVLGGKVPNGFGNTSRDVAVSGFHHAHYDSAGGYCTFNGLVIAAQKVLADGTARRILILDCDMHYGDGTDQILERLGLTSTFTNVTFGRWFHQPTNAGAYLQRLRETVARFDSFDLVLYQAGADVHVDDPLGGVLTTEQMIERDHIVFEAARVTETPIAWNLAGGYQEPLSKVVDLHVNTLRECLRAFASPSSAASARSAATAR